MRIKRDESGAAAVEFAILMPLLFILIFGIIEFGFAFYAQQGANAGVREGARKAAVGHITSCSNDSGAGDLLAVIRASSQGVSIDGTGMTLTDEDGNGADPGDTITVTVNYRINTPVTGGLAGFSLFQDLTAQAQTRLEHLPSGALTSC